MPMHPDSASVSDGRIARFAARHPRAARMVVHVTMTAIAGAVLWIMALVVRKGLADGQTEAARWGCRAVLWWGFAALTMHAIWYDRALHRTRPQAGYDRAAPLPDRQTFRPGRLGFILSFVGTFAFAAALTATTIWLYVFDAGQGGLRHLIFSIASALFVALAGVGIWRIVTDPERICRYGLILDREGLTIDGWTPQRFAWTDVTDIRQFVTSRMGLKQHHLELTLRDGAPGTRRRWRKPRKIVRHPLIVLLDRPDLITGRAVAFLDRARREQPAAAPSHPSPSQ